MRKIMGFLSRFWRRLRPEKRPISSASATESLPPVDPEPVFVAAHDEVSVGRFVVIREAVLSQSMTVVGYAFAQVDVLTPTQYEFDRDSALLKYVCGEQTRKMVGDRISFISIGQQLLADPMIEFLGLNRTVPLIRTPALLHSGAQTIDRIAALKQAGVTVGVEDGKILLEHDALASAAGVAILSVTELLPPDLLQIARQLSKQYPALKLGVRGLETQEEFDACRRLGFTFFQGPFIRRREQWSQSQVSPSTMRVCDLLTRMRGGAELDEIAEEVKLDPMISYRILRLANSPAVGATQHIGSIKDALVLIGRDALYRWFVVLLCSTEKDSLAHQATMELALARGRLMELLAGEGSTPAMQQTLFLTGMLSLLDVMLKVPMHSLVSQLTLPLVVKDALISGAGPCSQRLQLAEACDQADQARIVELCAALHIDLDAFNQMLASAGAWAREFSQSL